MYGYDSGVLGGLQETDAYLKALQVCLLLLNFTSSILTDPFLVPQGVVYHTYGCFLLHPGSSGGLIDCDDVWNGAWTPILHCPW